MTRKLKRAVLITCAAILVCLALLMVAIFIDTYLYVFDTKQPIENQPWRKDFFTYLISSTDIAVTCVCVACALAVVDMLISVAEKRYNMKMFGIAMALLAMIAVRMLLYFVVYAFQWDATDGLHWEITKTLFWSYFFGQLAIMLANIGLAISYVFTKRKYVKAQSKE